MSDQFAGGGGGGELPYEATGGIDSHGTINEYRKYPDQYVDRVIATYENDSDDATEIEVAFAVPEGSKIVEWLLPDDAEKTTRAPQAIIANLPDESFDQQDILSRQDEFDFYSYDVEVPAESEDFVGEMRPGRVRCGVEIESELGQENELGVWILGSFAGGSGTSSDPYLIEDWNHLDNVRDNLDDSFELVNDLDSETVGYDDHASESANGGDGWEPIGEDSGNRFEGTFDGQGHKIADFVIDRSGEDYVGLFGGSGGIIENVGVTNVDVTGNRRVAALAGYNAGEINSSHAIGDVTGEEGVGGLVGENRSSGGHISKSYATGNVTGNVLRVGGLVGENRDAGHISKSYATGNVTGGDEVGGLVGLNWNNTHISKSYATGDVTGGEIVGGFVGLEDSGDENLGINRCYSANDSVSGSGSVGAFCGQLGDSFGGYIFDSYVDIQLSSQSDSIGNFIASEGDVDEKQTAEMQGDSPLTEMDGFDFDDTWETVEKSDSDAIADWYPILQAIERQTQLESQGIYGFILFGKVTQDSEVENATVVAVNLDTDDLEGITTTDENGDYEFDLSHLDNFPYELIVAVDFEDSGGDRFGRAKTIMFEP